MKSDITELSEAIRVFRDDRDWKQYHDPKNLAISLNVESAELLDLFQWNRSADPENVKRELADVFYAAFLIAESYKFDIKQIVLDKLKENESKYPVSKALGSNKKYSDL